jgi:creatinine amidohydrolase
MRFGDCTYHEIAALAGADAVAVLPLGCTEQQGAHLPVGFDTWFAEALVTAAADQAEADSGVRVLVLPVLPAGPASEHRSFGAGYLDLPVPVHETIVRAALDSLCAQRFTVAVVWRGCGGHDVRDLVAGYNAAGHGMRVHLPEPPFQSLWSAAGGPAVSAGHADSFTTSIMPARPQAAVSGWPGGIDSRVADVRAGQRTRDADRRPVRPGHRRRGGVGRHSRNDRPAVQQARRAGTRDRRVRFHRCRRGVRRPDHRRPASRLSLLSSGLWLTSG